MIPKKKIKLYSWKAPGGQPNFGDELGPELIQNLFSYIEVVYEPDITKADMISVGSLLHILLDLEHHRPRKKMHIWGSGTIYPLQASVGSIKETYPLHDFSTLNFSKLKFHAVRGKLTQKDLKLPALPLGDPGLLVNKVYKESPVKENKVGIIPHFEEADHPLIKQLAADSRFKIIDVLRTPQDVITDITSCNLVFSSSLHGLIVADSFGIPNLHMNLSDRLVGGDFKFEDYYSAIGKQHQFADLDLMLTQDYQEQLIQDYQPIEALQEKQEALLKAFPYRKTNYIYSLLAKLKIIS
ncbi:polysaccharide pyruvyl transferase family protein [Lactococcus formosensis subsp. formosensis]|uniref:polysaccharide pyruvyl transferase family protein n=1 Tax=Lactococcus formosensis TaxID=1281486 RepID=UPI0007CBA107|nr:polysaccharide pyruvyl transferase family protein [Lactococcus formosensis]BAV02599.1 Exopolysaccharide glucosyl ketal-pyruvate-transferase [Lactococcus formosensis]BDW48468.1 exoV-like protein [Lactococcus formosensis]BDX24053.1 exoV-like protein [Lactococcus formosensis]